MVGFIENTAMRHRRGGWVKGDDDVYYYTRWRLKLSDDVTKK